VPGIDLTDNNEPWLILGSGRNLQQVLIVPQSLSFNEIDAMLGKISVTFVWIELKIHNDIKIIPFWRTTQVRCSPIEAKLRNGASVKSEDSVSSQGIVNTHASACILEK
jgi:hypothetical protein